MKKLVFIFVFALHSCGLYYYGYNDENREIISKKDYNINTIWINDVNDNFIVSYKKNQILVRKKLK